MFSISYKNEQYDFSELKTPVEEFVEDVPKDDILKGISAYEFIQTFPKHEVDRNIFLDKYSEKELDELVAKGDVFIPNSKLIKVLE